nr:hypothetical protein GCM10023233_26740 [Brevibacterium otitidis]
MPTVFLNQRLSGHLCKPDVDIERLLPVIDPAPGMGQQNPELGLGMRRPDVLDDALPTARILSHLHRSRPGLRADPPDEHHPTTLNDPR